MLGGETMESDTTNGAKIGNTETTRTASEGSRKEKIKQYKCTKQTSQGTFASPRDSSPAAKSQTKSFATEQLKQSLSLEDTDSKITTARSKKRGRPSTSTNLTPPQDANEKFNDSNLEVTANYEAKNAEKDSSIKNVTSTFVTKSATSKSLKTLETYIETMGIDVPSNRQLLAYNRVGKVCLALIEFFVII